MTEVLPAILDKDYNTMYSHLQSVVGLVNTAQIDFCDGVFVPSKTWPYASGLDENGDFRDAHFLKILNEEEGMPFWQEIEFEFHLMIKNGSKHFDTFMKLGPKSMLFQIEAEESVESFKEFVESLDPYVRDSVKIGISVTTSTPIKDIESILSIVDHVQFMGIERVGEQGLPFDERVFMHIKEVHEKYPDLLIAVDGSVNTNTAPRLVEAGVKNLIIGSALLNSDNIPETVKEFQSL